MGAYVASFLQGLRDPAGWVLHLIVGVLTHFVDGARHDIEVVLQRYLFTTVDTSVAATRAFTDNPPLRHLNFGMALAMDVLLAGVLVFALLRSLFERSYRARYSLKVMIPRLMAAIVFVHFSLPLVQMGIDLDNALGHVALGLGDAMHVDGLPWSPALSSPVVAQMSATQDIFHAVFAVGLVIALVILVLAYIVRYALLSVLVVVAPMAALCTVLPETRGYARTWLRLFMVTVFMQAVQLIVLRVAVTLAFDTTGAGLVQTLYGLATLVLLLKVPGALNTASHMETKAKTLAHHVERAVHHAVHPTSSGSHRSTTHKTA
ncbi:MAG TPA: conjugal transfer protein TrbL family protein [Candidatus Dormibacteraeota bacterium]|nr:conjugal transfer protein TrbL family protein [Candidatus Dormibacteraeota bacterium]